MSATAAPTRPEGVIEVDGMLWKPKRGATASADEFIAARTLFLQLHQESRWNPWVLDHHQAELEHATDVMDEWRRAEPGHRMLTSRQIEARMARHKRGRAREQAKRDAERDSRKAQHVPERSEARLALIEQQSRLDYEIEVLAGFRDGTRFPAMDSTRREREIDELEQSVDERRQEIERLITVVGDAEQVVDKHGWLPIDRRERMLLHYKYDRQGKVQQLRQEISQLEVRLTAPIDRKERANIRTEIATLRHRLDELLAVPPLNAEDMCSECPTPLSKHGWVTPPYEGPCPAWPRWAARLQRARGILMSASRSEPAAVGPVAPKPQPLAVIPSGLPIAEVTKRLQDLAKQHPNAEVRRGRANRWELWPTEHE